eukprot:358509-Chlamydomonas_euryale.AAC.2
MGSQPVRALTLCKQAWQRDPPQGRVKPPGHWCCGAQVLAVGLPASIGAARAAVSGVAMVWYAHHWVAYATFLPAALLGGVGRGTGGVVRQRCGAPEVWGTGGLGHWRCGALDVWDGAPEGSECARQSEDQREALPGDGWCGACGSRGKGGRASRTIREKDAACTQGGG